MKLFNEISKTKKEPNEEIKEEYIKLRKEIERYNDYYYNKEKPLISDNEYDKLILKLENLENEYIELKNIDFKNELNISGISPTEKIGGIADENFSKVEHTTPMLSLSNIYDFNGIDKFNKSIKNILETEKEIEYILELKLDGLSISLIYENGIFSKAVTRGDGQIGEDVTENVREIESVPKELTEKINVEVRGEIVLPISNFDKINELREEAGEDVFSNPRNAASGTIRQLDKSVVKERGLDCYIYYLLNPEKYNITNHLDSIKFIEKLGFKTTKVFEKYINIKKMKESIENWNKKRKKLDYETDGLVLKINDFSLYNLLGYTTKSPKWAIAYKFPAEQKETKLLDVSFQIGRTGVVTPVAELKPIKLGGSIVKRASLHNFDEIERKDIKIGDTVVVQKAAEIIPQVVNSVFDKRNGDEINIEKPKNCPSCGTKLIREENQVALKCINQTCPERLKKEIEYFVSRDGMNISGLGEKLVEKFIELGKIKTILDIYDLSEHKEELKSQEKMGDKSVENLLNNIELSKTRGFDKVLYSLGIPYVGKFMSRLLVKEFKNIETIKAKNIDELEEIKGIGKKGAISIYNYLNNEKNWDKILSLKEKGLQFSISEVENSEENTDSKIYGKKFLATGKLNKYKREEIKDLILLNGGEYISSVSKKLDYLVIGKDPGSKLSKAEELGIKIITEDEFETLLK